MAGKVDAEDGKGLSSNDYTNDEKAKLAGIAEGAEKNVQADWNAESGAAAILNKPSEFTPAEHTHSSSDITGLSDALAGKVDAEDGKGLSSNDFTGDEKAKLEAIEAGAEKNIVKGITVGGNAVIPDADGIVNLPNQESGVGTDFVGATAESDGTAGLVPAPASSELGKFLSAEGGWSSVDPYQFDDAFNTTSLSNGRQRVSLNPAGFVMGSSGTRSINSMMFLSKEAYNALAVKDPNTLYLMPAAQVVIPDEPTDGAKYMTTWSNDFSNGISGVTNDANGWYDLDLSGGALRAILREPNSTETLATFYIDLGQRLDLSEGAYLSIDIKSVGSEPNSANAIYNGDTIVKWNDYNCFAMRLIDNAGNYSNWINIGADGLDSTAGIKTDGTTIDRESISSYMGSTIDRSNIRKIEISLIGWPNSTQALSYKQRNKGVTIDNIILSRSATETADEGKAVGTVYDPNEIVYRRVSDTYSFSRTSFNDAATIYNGIRTSDGDRVIFIVRHSERDSTSGKDTGINSNGLALINANASKLTGAPFTDASNDLYMSTNVKRTVETAYFVGVNRGYPNTTQTSLLGSNWESNTAVDHSGDTSSSVAAVQVTPGPHTYFNDRFTGGTGWPNAQYYYRDNKVVCNEKCTEAINWVAEASAGHPFTFVSSHDLCMVPFVCWAADDPNMFSTWYNDYDSNPSGWLNYMAGIAVIVHADGGWEVYPTNILSSGKFA